MSIKVTKDLVDELNSYDDDCIPQYDKILKGNRTRSKKIYPTSFCNILNMNNFKTESHSFKEITKRQNDDFVDNAATLLQKELKPYFINNFIEKYESVGIKNKFQFMNREENNKFFDALETNELFGINDFDFVLRNNTLIIIRVQNEKKKRFFSNYYITSAILTAKLLNLTDINLYTYYIPENTAENVLNNLGNKKVISEIFENHKKSSYDFSDGSLSVRSYKTKLVNKTIPEVQINFGYNQNLRYKTRDIEIMMEYVDYWYRTFVINDIEPTLENKNELVVLKHRETIEIMKKLGIDTEKDYSISDLCF